MDEEPIGYFAHIKPDGDVEFQTNVNKASCSDIALLYYTTLKLSEWFENELNKRVEGTEIKFMNEE